MARKLTWLLIALMLSAIVFVTWLIDRRLSYRWPAW